MHFKNSDLSFLFVCLLLTLAEPVLAMTVNIPTDKPMGIRDGTKIWFGDEWISTSGTDIHLSEWKISWITYSCDGPGSQQIYIGSKPFKVFIDALEKNENDGWSYSTGIVTITTATQSATIQRLNGDHNGDGIVPFGGRPDYTVHFVVTRSGLPLSDCRIEIYELPYGFIRTVMFTDDAGMAETSLQAGHYSYNATCLDKMRGGTFWIAGEETIRIDFGRQKLSISPQLMVLLLVGAIIVVGAIGISRAKL